MWNDSYTTTQQDIQLSARRARPRRGLIFMKIEDDITAGHRRERSDHYGCMILA